MKHILQQNKAFWFTHVPTVWESLPLDHKLAYLVFGVYTISLITIIELFLLKK